MKAMQLKNGHRPISNNETLKFLTFSSWKNLSVLLIWDEILVSLPEWDQKHPDLEIIFNWYN